MSFQGETRLWVTSLHLQTPSEGKAGEEPSSYPRPVCPPRSSLLSTLLQALFRTMQMQQMQEMPLLVGEGDPDPRAGVHRRLTRKWLGVRKKTAIQEC